MHNPFTCNPQLNRRQFMGAAGAVGVFGVSKSLFPHWMPRLAFRDQAAVGSPPGDVLICIFLRGGMDGLSVVVPYAEGSNYYTARPTLRILEPGNGAERALDLDGQFGLHPVLAPLKELYTAGALGIVHATGLTDPSRSHFDAMAFMEAGTPGSKLTTTGWIGRHLQSAAWQNASPFRAVGMGALVPQSLRGNIPPLALRSIADFHFKGREDEMQKMLQVLGSLYTIDAPTDRVETQAKLVFETVDLLDRLDVNTYTPANGAVYPDDEFGLGLRQIAQLIKADVGLEVACVDLGGWDTHEAQGVFGGQFEALLRTLGDGLAALYSDLRDSMANISVVTMSEFGRRVHENGSRGTDHGHGNVMFLLGGGINGGQVHTVDWPGLAATSLDDGDLKITIDYRNVLGELVQKRLLNSALDQIFPGHTANDLGIIRARG